MEVERDNAAQVGTTSQYACGRRGEGDASCRALQCRATARGARGKASPCNILRQF
jgi:hypothetical protein